MYVCSYLHSNCTKFDNYFFFVIFVIVGIKFVRKKKHRYIHEENIVLRTSPGQLVSYKQRTEDYIYYIRMSGNIFIKFYYYENNRLILFPSCFP